MRSKAPVLATLLLVGTLSGCANQEASNDQGTSASSETFTLTEAMNHPPQQKARIEVILANHRATSLNFSVTLNFSGILGNMSSRTEISSPPESFITIFETSGLEGTGILHVNATIGQEHVYQIWNVGERAQPLKYISATNVGISLSETHLDY